GPYATLEATSADPGWTTVRRRWPGDPGAPGGRPNRVGFDYDAYIPGEIARWEPAIPASLAADAGRVEEAIAGLARLGIASLLWPLLRTEAIASSRIEGLRIDHERLARAAFGETDDGLARAVLGNLDALRRALDVASLPITIGAILGLHRALLAGTRDAAIAGRLRDGQNWIGGRQPNPRGAAFIPPPEGEVPRLLDDLCRFCERDDLQPSLQAAIAHVQFETIHPFADGNGRVGRALVHVVLRRRGLTADGQGEPVPPPLSLAFAADPDGYVAGLTAFRSGDHERWLDLFVAALHRATVIAEALAGSVDDLRARWREQAGHPRRDSAAEAIIAGLAEQPVLDLGRATTLTGVSGEATRRAIDRLAAAGVLREITGGRRRRRWQAAGLLELLDGLGR
ncbi:MAG: Fic family protein, partial [Thermoleophilia bacterium]